MLTNASNPLLQLGDRFRHRRTRERLVIGLEPIGTRPARLPEEQCQAAPLGHCKARSASGSLSGDLVRNPFNLGNMLAKNILETRINKRDANRYV
jgi:hypothetical protein